MGQYSGVAPWIAASQGLLAMTALLQVSVDRKLTDCLLTASVNAPALGGGVQAERRDGCLERLASSSDQHVIDPRHEA